MENKIQEFLKEYGELTKKYNVDFAAFPVYMPNEKGTFDLTIQTQPIDLSERKKKKGFFSR